MATFLGVGFGTGSASAGAPRKVIAPLIAAGPDCPIGVITNTGPPVASGVVALGNTLTTTNGSWTSCGEAITGHTYRWLRDGLLIANATSSSYVVTSSDVGHVIASAVAACNADGCYTPNIESSNSLGGPVISASTADYFTFVNHDGIFTIYKRCLGQNWHRAQSGNPNDNRTVGPGYIARAYRIDGDGTRPLILDDERPPSYTYGGLATFGFHSSRWRLDAPQETSPLTGLTDYVFDAQHDYAIEGRECSTDDPVGFQPVSGIGVSSTNVFQPESVSGGVLNFGIDVRFRDPYEAADLLIVRYRYKVTDSQVQLWATVWEGTPYAASDNAFIKEPKFEFTVSAGNYTRQTMLNTSDLPALNQYNTGNQYCSWMGSDPSVGTGQCDGDERYRARYDFGTVNFSGGSDVPNCLYATDRCLNVIGKSVATVDTPGVTTYSWEKSGYGLDAWAAGEPLLYPQSVPGISKFASQDGSGGGGSPQPWRCNADPNFGGTVEKLRRWEMGGYKTNGVYTNAKMATHAWEGGRSGYDCELLAFKDNKVGQMFGNYFSISIGPGYTQQ